MDQDGTDREKLMEELKRKLDGGCVDFSQENQAWMEELAMCDERLLEEYLENGGLPVEEIPGLVQNRQVFPCYFGSALKLDGVKEFLEGLEKYTAAPSYPEAFGAKVYKIARDGSRRYLSESDWRMSSSQDAAHEPKRRTGGRRADLGGKSRSDSYLFRCEI